MLGRKCCREGFRREVCEYYEHLLGNPHIFFDKGDCLNSDGRRLFEKIVRMLLEDQKESRRIASLARRNPCIDEIVKLGILTFYKCNPLEVYMAGRGLLGPTLDNNSWPHSSTRYLDS